MSKRAVEVKLSSEDTAILEQWCLASTTSQRLALRARIALAAAGGEATTSIARRERVRVATVSKWRRRCAEQGRAGLQDTPRAGRRRRYTEVTMRRVLKQLDQSLRSASPAGTGVGWPRPWGMYPPGRCGAS